MNAIRSIQSIQACHRKQPAVRGNATHPGQMVVGLEDPQNRRLSARRIGSVMAKPPSSSQGDTGNFSMYDTRMRRVSITIPQTCAQTMSLLLGSAQYSKAAFQPAEW